MEPIRIAATSREAEEWALVLTALGIPNAVRRHTEGWALLAAPGDTVRADAALAAYEREQRDAVSPPMRDAEPYPWVIGAVLGLLLLWCYSVTGVPTPGSRWFDAGAAAAGRIVNGEWWRTVTALTLHVDIVHVAGNALALTVLFPPCVQRLGAGVSFLVLVISGAVGNALAAALHAPAHLAVGASTAAFGLVGALVALRVLARDDGSRRKRWTAPVAGVVLLVMLGASRDADLTAHLTGFVTGVVVGAAAGLVVGRRPGLIVQAVATGAAAALVLGAWLLALRHV
jgi:rhomboid protease GluP